jgi:hypothetical protein
MHDIRWDEVVVMRDIKQYFWKHPFKEPCHPQTYINTKSIFLIIIPRLVVDPQLSENALPYRVSELV